MAFIGFIVNKKDEDNFEKALKNTIKECTISINEKSIANVKNIHFETVIIDRNISKKYENYLSEIIKTSKYLIVNADKFDFSQIKNANLTIITYGFSNKSTVTTSSVEDETILICLQRSIKNIKGKYVETQELKANLPDNSEDLYLKMAIRTVELLYN